jgi:hypothetical protein
MSPPLCLGVYRQSLSTESVDGVAYFQDSPQGTLEYPLSEEEQKLVIQTMEELVTEFNVPSKVNVVGVREIDEARIAFAVECKQYAEPLTLPQVKGIISTKFKPYHQSPLYFIITMEFTGKVPSISVPGHRFWILERVSINFLRLVELRSSDAPPVRRDDKIVVLISLEVIWGGDRRHFDDLSDKLRLAGV